MTTLDLQGHITKKGKLEIDLPKGLPEGDVRVRIDLPDEESTWEGQPWTEEEIQELTKPKRKTMAELTAWLDANPPTDEWGGMDPDDDPGEFIHKLRRQDRIVLESPEDAR